MTLRSYANKRDKSEAAIVEVLRKAGCSVIHMDRPVDLLVRYRGQVHLVECKSGKRGRLTKSQRDLIDDRWPVFVIRDIDEALAVLTEWGVLPAQKRRAA